MLIVLDAFEPFRQANIGRTGVMSTARKAVLKRQCAE